MAKPKSENSKVAAAKDRKANTKAEKDAKAQSAKDAQEDLEWSKGAKKSGKSEDKAAKKAEQQAKKAELDALKRKEEEEISKIKVKKSGDDKKAAKKQANLEKSAKSRGTLSSAAIELSASNIDDALDMFTAIDDSKTTLASKAGMIDQHPERRAKAAYNAYEEKRLPILKEENKGLRLTQLKQLLWKEWQKSPENPFNQAAMAYNATKDEKQNMIEQTRKDIESRLKI